MLAPRISPPRLHKPGLVTTIAIVSLVPIAVIAVVLAHVMEGQVRERAIAEATRSATLIGRVGLQPQLSRDAVRDGLSPFRLTALDETFAEQSVQSEIARIAIWNRSARIIYSDEPNLIDRTFPLSRELRAALGGQVETEIAEADEHDDFGQRGGGTLLQVLVPFTFAGSARPDGVFQLYLPYEPIEAAVTEDTRVLVALLLLGLTVLYAALFPIALGASRTLRRQAAENEYQALHDALTGLPNRTLFRDRLAHALAIARREGHGVAVLLADVDRFKEVNDSLGHDSGDVLLRELSRRLRAVVRESDTIARLGGDEFGVLLPSVHEGTAPADAAERIVAALEEPFELDGVPVAVEASIGIALAPEHGEDVDTLVQRADVAMYVAKAAHQPFAGYDPAHDVNSPSRLRLVAELRRAIDERELTLYYQPKERLETGDVVGVEALVRWNHPERGLLPPSEFVPLAQHTNLIRPLTLFVLETALEQCRAWKDEGLSLRVAVNLSARSLLDADLAEDVERLLARWNLDPDVLELEITETMIMADPARAAAILGELNALGVRIAIDDFGTGYSSLAYLSGLPVDEIKIDRSFVAAMGGNTSDAAIVRSTIDLGRNLGLGVVAEGVETEDVWLALRDLGCDAAQGYFLSRPVPPPALAAWVRSRATANIA
ncbi:MAG: EAL domain-containing protein [Thermoleophilia bacterium]|nr:EAL domain-containing protein [Thermoleophilia bacterium]